MARSTEPRLWRIIGGEERGGVLVRAGKELSSDKLPERLSYGAIVEEISLELGGLGERLWFRRRAGTGPSTGWISIALDHKVLAERINFENDFPEPSSAAANQAPLALSMVAAADEEAASTSGAPAAEAGTATEESGPRPEAEGPASTSEHAEKEPDKNVEDKGPRRFEEMPAVGLPKDVSECMKWLVWNELWLQVNKQFSMLYEGSHAERARLAMARNQTAVEQHILECNQKRYFSRSTIMLLRSQATLIGEEVSKQHKTGNWLAVARTASLPVPPDMEIALWKKIVKGIRLASMAVLKGAMQDTQRMQWHQIEFEDHWACLSG